MQQKTFLKQLENIRILLGKKRWFVPLLFTYICFQLLIIKILEPIGKKSFFMHQLSFSAEQIRFNFNHWQNIGLLHFYQLHLIPDLIHPVTYCLLLVSLLSLLFLYTRAGGKWNVLFLLPIIAAYCDEIENILQVIFLSSPQYSMVIQPFVSISATCSWIKWICAAITILFIILFGATRLIKSLLKK